MRLLITKHQHKPNLRYQSSMNRNERIQYFQELSQLHKNIQDFSESLDIFKSKLRSSIQYPAFALEDEPKIIIRKGLDTYFFEEQIMLYLFVKAYSDTQSDIDKAWADCKLLVRDILSYILFRNELEREEGDDAILLDFSEQQIKPYLKFSSDNLVAYSLPIIHKESYSLVYDPANWYIQH